MVADAGAGDEGQAERLEAALVVGAVAAGLVIAWLDSRPSWDDTGITVGLLFVASAAAAFVAGRRPWLWALLVGGPLPLIEIAMDGTLASLIALTFGAVGAALGWAIRRGLGPVGPDRP
ncbi:MAG TPA: hypothetical protein VFW20_03575 [Candidatus Limnocylindrales bacterium]|nr:hypothetical protein [Candidatus Limnocylindrales bacterium]